MNDLTEVGSEPLREGLPIGEGAQLLALLSAPDIELATLAACWHAFAQTGRAGSLELYQKLSKAFLESNAPLLAFDVTRAGLEHEPKDLVLRLRQGLALARSGAVERANELAITLRAEGHRDNESLGLLARTHKDLALIAPDQPTRDRHLGVAFDIYNATFQRNESYWHGINAATLSVLCGDFSTAIKLAGAICDQLQSKLPVPEGDERYWMLATLGEAELIRGHWQDAVASYKKAVTVGKAGLLATTRKQARLLMNHRPDDDGLREEARAAVEACFEHPRVVAFVGHMVDQKNRRNERLPGHLSDRFGVEISAKLEKLGKVVGYSSAACGSDILFLEAVQTAGFETHVVLPYNREDFARDSVVFAGEKWRDRFNAVLARAVKVTMVSPHQSLSWGSVSYDYANRVLTGLALIHAKELDTEFATLAVWDGMEGDGLGGTASVVKRWQVRQKQKVAIIDPKEVMEKAKYQPRRSNGSAPSASSRRTSLHGATEVRATMFIDVVGFTRLTEEQMPGFVEHFLYQVGAMAAVSPDRPVVQEPRGDGVFFAFDSIAKAGRFALDVCARVRGIRWKDYGLPEDFRVRIGLHAGPVYHFLCPFTKQLSYTGHHVNHAARIEAITVDGEVYASLGFAALASEEFINDFHCEYAGLVALPKQYGTFPVYHLHRHG